jgi:hypothetical protein
LDLDFFALSDAAAIEGGAVLIPLFDSSELFERRAAALLTQQQSSASSASWPFSFEPAFSASSSSSLSPSSSTGAEADTDAKDAAKDAEAFEREIDAALARLQHAWTRRAWRADSVEFSVPAHCAAAAAHVRVRCFVQIDRALMPVPSASSSSSVSSLSASTKGEDDDDDDDANDGYDSADDELRAHDAVVDDADDDDYDSASIGSDGGRGVRPSQSGLRGRRVSTSSSSGTCRMRQSISMRVEY